MIVIYVHVYVLDFEYWRKQQMKHMYCERNYTNNVCIINSHFILTIH